MDCSKVTDRLSFYLDGALDDHTLEIVEAHLSGCPHCRRELAFLKMMIEAAGEIEAIQPPVGLRTRIATAIEHEKPAAGVAERLSRWTGLWTRPVWVKFAGAAAAFAAFAAVVISLHPVQPTVATRPVKHPASVARVAPAPALKQPEVSTTQSQARVAIAEASAKASAQRRAIRSRRIRAEIASAAKSKRNQRKPSVRVAVREPSKPVDEAVASEPETPAVEVAATPTEVRPAAKMPEPPEIKVASAPAVLIDAGEDDMKQIKAEASMRRNRSGMPSVSLFSSRF